MPRYEHTPRPEIERHYHIQELIEAQEKRTADRNQDRSRKKNLEDREDYIKDSKRLTTTDFYCDTCQEDFKAVAWRQIETDWNNENQRIAFYKTKCWKGHWCIRYITDKLYDPFFTKSKLLARERAKYYNDALQPHQDGYSLLYRHKHEKT